MEKASITRSTWLGQKLDAEYRVQWFTRQLEASKRDLTRAAEELAWAEISFSQIKELILLDSTNMARQPVDKVGDGEEALGQAPQ